MDNSTQLIIEDQRTPLSDIYIGNSDEFIAQLKECYSTLSKEEKIRADKFKIVSVRDTYVVCHGQLRQMLANRLGEKAGKIQIDSDKYGKPKLKDHPLYFNISHSGKAFAIAISEDKEIGIDIEEIKHNFQFNEIIRSFFHPNEICSIETESDNTVRLRKFYTYWTRKEAFLKAIGIGLINDLKSIDTSCKNIIQPTESLKPVLADTIKSSVNIRSWVDGNIVISYARWTRK